MTRPTFDETYLGMAELVARRSTCYRRAVGCVLTDDRNRIVATGYNGRARGLQHCNQTLLARSINGTDEVTYPHACAGAQSPSGTDLDACEAIHAEQNALLACRDVYGIATCYVTVAPCVTCAKLLLNTSCSRILFTQDYAHPAARVLWETTGRRWVKLAIGDPLARLSY